MSPIVLSPFFLFYHASRICSTKNRHDFYISILLSQAAPEHAFAPYIGSRHNCTTESPFHLGVGFVPYAGSCGICTVCGSCMTCGFCMACDVCAVCGICTVCGFCREALGAASLWYRLMTGGLPLDGNPVGYILGYVLPWPPSSPDAGKGSRPLRRCVCCPRPRGRMGFGLLI